MECRKAKISPVKSETAKVWVFEQISHQKIYLPTVNRNPPSSVIVTMAHTTMALHHRRGPIGHSSAHASSCVFLCLGLSPIPILFKLVLIEFHEKEKAAASASWGGGAQPPPSSHTIPLPSTIAIDKPTVPPPPPPPTLRLCLDMGRLPSTLLPSSSSSS